MRLGTAIERLVDNYRYASDKEWIRDKVAWALYHTWKEADRKTEPQKKEVEGVYNKRERLWYPYSNGELLFKTENNSEKPNNCEHITEDGVTCAKYPACDDCLDNPLNKVKGSERLLKGSEFPNNCEDGYMTAEQAEDYRKMLDKAEHKVYGNIEDEPTISIMEQVEDEPQTMYYPQVDGITPSVIAKDEPQTDVYEYHNGEWVKPDCAWK